MNFLWRLFESISELFQLSVFFNCFFFILLVRASLVALQKKKPKNSFQKKAFIWAKKETYWHYVRERPLLKKREIIQKKT
jgi:hypothetical protein